MIYRKKLICFVVHWKIERRRRDEKGDEKEKEKQEEEEKKEKKEEEVVKLATLPKSHYSIKLHQKYYGITTLPTSIKCQFDIL
jgi:hypothetical protein